MSDKNKLARTATTARFGAEVGCHDGGCLFGHAGGMQTNGGCRCRDEMGSHMRLSVLFKEAVEREAALREQVDTLQKQLDITRSDLSLAWADCEDGSCRACPKCCDDRDATIATLTKDCERYAKTIGNDRRDWAAMRHDLAILTRDRNEARAYATCRDVDIKGLRVEAERLSTLLATQTKWAQESADLLKVTQVDVERLTKELEAALLDHADYAKKADEVSSPDCPRNTACGTIGFHAADECTGPTVEPQKAGAR